MADFVIGMDGKDDVFLWNRLLAEPSGYAMTILAIGIIEVEDDLLILVITQTMRLPIFSLEGKVEGGSAREILVVHLDLETDSFFLGFIKSLRTFHPSEEEKVGDIVAHRRARVVEIMVDEALKLLLSNTCKCFCDENFHAPLCQLLTESRQEVDIVDEALLRHVGIVQLQGVGEVEAVPIVQGEILHALLHGLEGVGHGGVGE